MTDDDQYIPDTLNAHIDTAPFVERLLQKLSEHGAPNSRDNTADFHASRRADCYRFVYDEVDAVASVDVQEPENDALLCRYLSPEKFLWFIADSRIHLSRPDTFDDQAECSLHEDYELAIKQHLDAFLERACGSQPDQDDAAHWNKIQAEWHTYERARRNDWLVSCWTQITDHFDDKLLSFKYSGGRFGVGIAVRYGELKKLLLGLSELDRDKRLWSGYVSYKPSTMKVLPFNKRPGFRNEREVRFALRTVQNAISVPVGALENFGLRLSADSPQHHRAAVRLLWVQAGGGVHNIHEET